MKNLKMFAVAALAAMSMSATAQVTYGYDQEYTPTRAAIYGADNESFGLFYAQFNPSKIHSKATSGSASETESESVNAVTLGYNYYISLSEDLPLYIAPGIAAQWFFKNTKEHGEEDKFNMISAKIPVNVMYSIQVSDGFRIEPYAGVYGRVNIWGEEKYTDEDGTEKANIFDKDEMGDLAFKRFQLGWNAGVNFRITNAFTIGVGYYMDLLKVQELDGELYGYRYSAKSNFQGFDITLGVNF